MTKGSLVNFYSEEDQKKLLNFSRASELRSKALASSAVKTEPEKSASPSAVDVCEFARGFVYEGSDGRFCVDGTFCPSRIYGCPALFLDCVVRLKRLKEEKEQT